ncbi:MAG: hypothetical protein H6841_09220 [Planctomycetes bacterium]|nr:hypothetical protein [Planctomycetota bacterium]
MKSACVLAVCIALWCCVSTPHPAKADDEGVANPTLVAGGGAGKQTVKSPKANPDDGLEDIEIPAGAKKITIKTSEPLPNGHLGGEINPVVQNDSRSDATDVHVHVSATDDQGKPVMLRVSSMSLTGGECANPEAVGVPGNGPSTGQQVPVGQPGKLTSGNTGLPNERCNGGKVTLNVVIEQWVPAPAPGSWQRYTGKEVDLRVWWTHGDARDKWVVSALPEGLGHGDDRVTLLSVYPEFDPSPIVVEPEQGGILELHHIALGEADNHRFQRGSVVIKPQHGQFVLSDETAVRAIDEEGADVSSERFSTTNLRIDDNGNFVFDITRDQEDELHIAFVISGLQLRLPLQITPGSSITASVGGAILRGPQYDNLWTLARATEE